MIPVILEIIHRTMPTASRSEITRSTTRVDGPYDASTAAFAAVAAVSLVVCRLTEPIIANATGRSNRLLLFDRDCSIRETELQMYPGWNDGLLRLPKTMRPRRQAAAVRVDRQFLHWDMRGGS